MKQNTGLTEENAHLICSFCDWSHYKVVNRGGRMIAKPGDASITICSFCIRDARRLVKNELIEEKVIRFKSHH